MNELHFCILAQKLVWDVSFLLLKFLERSDSKQFIMLILKLNTEQISHFVTTFDGYFFKAPGRCFSLCHFHSTTCLEFLQYHIINSGFPIHVHAEPFQSAWILTGGKKNHPYCNILSLDVFNFSNIDKMTPLSNH